LQAVGEGGVAPRPRPTHRARRTRRAWLRIGASTVWTILHAAGIDPAPRRVGPTWAQFLHAQAHAILACDVFHLDTITQDRLYAFFVIVWGSRMPHLPLSSGIGRCERSGMIAAASLQLRMPIPVWDPNPRA